MTIEGEAPAIAAGRRRLPSDVLVGAVWRIAFRRSDGEDVFARADVRLSDFVLPLLIVLAIGLTYEIAGDREMRAAMNLSTAVSLKVLGLVGGGLLLRALVGLFVTYLIAAPMVTPERLWPGLLGYQWTQAALVVPWSILARVTVHSHGPEMLVLLLSGCMLLGIFVCSVRVIRAAFGFSGWGAAIVIALAGSIVSYGVDLLLGMLLFG
jgi:hypothetical protein